MVLRNSFKVLSSNFSLVWKNMFYMLIVFLIFCGAIVGLGYNIGNVLSNAGFFASVGEFWGKLYSFSTSEISRQLVMFGGQFLDILADNISEILPNIIGICIVFFVMSVILNAVKLVNCEVLRGAMSSLAKFSFCGAYIRYFWSAILQGLIQTIIKLPFWAIIGVSGYFVLDLMTINELLAILAPMLFAIIMIFVLSFEHTILSCFVPYLVLHNDCVAHSLICGFKIVSHRFWRTLSNIIVFVIFAFVANFVCARYTFGASLLFTVPLTAVIVDIIFMVNYYESQGMRFYLDANNIMSPKKFAEHDRPSSARNVI